MNNVNRPADSFMVLPGMKAVYTMDPQRPGERRLPRCTWLPNRVRHMFISMIGEFVGTYLFLFFAFAATQVANMAPSRTEGLPNTSTLLYIALAFGFSLAVNVWIFFRISGGLFNPAVAAASLVDHAQMLIVRCVGDRSPCLGWSSRVAEGYPAHHLTNPRSHFCCWHCVRSSPRTSRCPHETEPQHFSHPRPVY